MDPFDTLGVHPSATLDTIRAAYRRRARDTHPDHGGDADAFRRVRWAWEQLQDPWDRLDWRWRRPRSPFRR